MTAAEVLDQPKPQFGQITLEDMRGNALLTRTVLPLIAEACRHTKGRFTLDVVTEGLTRGVFDLWGVMRPPASLDAIMVTTKAGDVFEILVLGPDADEAFVCLPALATAGRAQGCTRMRLTGPGLWERKLDADWRSAARIFERDL